MVLEEHIRAELDRVDQYTFERLIDNLLHQGAFPEVAPRNALVESYGTNIEKRRTIRSAPRTDAELYVSGTKIEKSVRDNWRRKFREDIENNAGRAIKRFVWCTNQNTGNKTLRDNGAAVDAREYCISRLNCEECIIIGSNDLVLALQNPEFCNIRRQFLNIPDDFFASPSSFLLGLESRPSLGADVEPNTLNAFSSQVASRLSFEPAKVIVAHNDDYVVLLHSLGEWARHMTDCDNDYPTARDYCFIRWPYSNIDLQGVDDREVKDGTETYVVIWGAHSIQNVNDFVLKFRRDNTCLVFVTPTLLKDEVIDRLKSFNQNLPITEITLESVDRRAITPDELRQHEEKLRAPLNSTFDRALQLEALIYFYSPVYLSRDEVRDRLAALLGLNDAELRQHFDLLVQSELAEVTGDLIWLTAPRVAKELLGDFINRGVFEIERLV